ncbi:pyruvate dehydrogenase (acetyl-transferring) kinase isozyme 2, mitochondrial-like [Ptychodera flava]|uniref:pyruvate dehydrogenase (acetyl-transferring) kinase isozyme 2, mitochondrial-like n=1 Tax=Ptychodera flava TaxID=63121 RepID=UPI00396A6DB9
MVHLTRCLSRALKSFPARMDHYSRFSPSPLSIQQFLDFGKRDGSVKKSFVFLRQELPVRIANIMKEINLLPDSLLKMPSVKLVQSWYLQSLKELLEYENADPNNDICENFTDRLQKIRDRHANVVETMAQGVIEMKETHGIDPQKETNLQYFLDRFFMSRISIRMLINQHTLVFGHNLRTHPRYIGSIDPNCDVESVIHDAFDSAKYLCDQYYLASPEMEIKTINATCKDKKTDVQLQYVPSHLYHMLFELLKNAMRAVVEHHGTASIDYPPLEILVCEGENDVTIKLSDKGGGIPRHQIDLLFHYMYSTAPTPPQPGSTVTAPLAGYGYGLPISRLYARYFHGDLQVTSVEGYGTDAIIYLKVLSGEANELLPIFNYATSKHYKTQVSSADWSSPAIHNIAVASGPRSMRM